MKIGGFIKSSMIDYPGKISCVVFTCGCNFICPYCHNAGLIKTVSEDYDTGFTDEEIFDFLEKRKGLLDGVAITGGEPTLQDDLILFCSKVKQNGFSIKLDTNGSRPEVLKELMDLKLIDYFAMDIKTDPDGYSPLITKKNDSSKIIESIEMIMASGIMYEFRTTCAKPFVDKNMIKKIGKIIKGARLYAIQAYNPENILNEAFFRKQGENYSDDEIEEFRQIAAGFVEKCIVR